MKVETLTPQQMADYGTSAPAPADPRVHRGNESDSAQEPPQGNDAPTESSLSDSNQPHSLRDALREATSRKSSLTSASTSEEDYDDNTHQPVAVLLKRNKDDSDSSSQLGNDLRTATMASGQTTPSDASFEATVDNVAVLKGGKLYKIASDDKELRDILRKGLQRVSEWAIRKGKDTCTC